MQGLVARMKIHYEKCKNDIPVSSDDVEVVGKLLKLLFTKQTKNTNCLSMYLYGFDDHT